MLSARYKDRITRFADPVAAVLVRLRLRPNQLTIFGLVLSLLSALAYARGRIPLGGVLLGLAGLLDLLDGSVARLSGQATPFGAFLDSVMDRYSDLTVLLGILYFYIQLDRTPEVFLAMATLVGSTMVSYTRARAEGVGVQCAVGLMERGERVLILVVASLANLLSLALWVLAPLINWTALQRIYHTWRVTNRRSARL
jgi:CDP-diacylglycerol--glycerol-3-phosphate 3-phosphatidyltransferase